MIIDKRDAHDTFFLTKPILSNNFPNEYLEKVKNIHEKGGYGSSGCVVVILKLIKIEF